MHLYVIPMIWQSLPSNPIFESVLKYVHPTHNYFTQIDSICYSGQLNICIVKRIAYRQQQKKNMKSLKFILYTILSVSCLVHILLIGHQLLHPNLPDTRVYKKYLKEIEFPISFRICAYNLSSATRKYENVGYRYAYDFFRGRSMYNRSLVGWGGHTKNGSYIGSVEEVLEKVSLNWTSILHKIRVYTTDEYGIDVPGNKIIWKKAPTYQDCQNLDFWDYFDLKLVTPLQIFFYVNKIENVAISLHVNERNKESFTYCVWEYLILMH